MNLLVIYILSAKKVQIRCLQKIYHIDIKTAFLLLLLPKACKANRRNIYIPTTIVLTNNDPSLVLHICFLGFNLACVKITDYTPLRSLIAILLTPDHLEKVPHRLPNYTMLNYDASSKLMKIILTLCLLGLQYLIQCWLTLLLLQALQLTVIANTGEPQMGIESFFSTQCKMIQIITRTF